MEKTYEELMETKRELKESYDELLALKDEVDESIKELEKTTKNSAASMIMRSIMATCAYTIVSKVADAFLPKSLKGPVKAAVTFGTFFIPEIAANAAGSITDKIMEE